jgi:hypothetical protein
LRVSKERVLAMTVEKKKGVGAETRNVLNDAEKLRAWDWMRANRKWISGMSEYERIRDRMEEKTGLLLNEQMLRKYLKLLGLRMKTSRLAEPAGEEAESADESNS